MQLFTADSATLPVLLPKPEDSNSRSEVDARTTRYGRQTLAFPSINGSELPMHPFVAWFAVTYALSMLARYEPKVWASRTAVSSSSDAVPIEHLLEQCLEAVPELIYTTMCEVVA
jgi:hypothetical protein